MLRRISLFFFLLHSLQANTQTTQISIGSSSTAESFTDIKFDPSDGGTVKVGRVNNAVTGNDCLIIKSDANNQIVWQKTISNSGDDAFYRVVVCANGDYVAIGQLYLGGVRRAFACRVAAANGNIIWSSASNNSSLGELFWDGIETADQNIALIGVDSYSPGQSNAFIVMLNSSGSLIWSRVSTRSAADEFKTINQLSNGNLIVSGFYDAGGNYNAVILEIDPATAAINSQNAYSINTTVPGGVGSVNSIWENQCYYKNNTAEFSLNLFQGYGTVSNQAICVYDQTTKTLTGNIYYHTGNNNAVAYSFYPISNNDFLIGQSFSSPTNVYVSRITAGVTAFDRKITNSIAFLAGADLKGSTVAFGGSYLNSDNDGYSLISGTNIPVSATCSIADANILAAQALTMNPTSGSFITLSPVFSIVNFVQAAQNTSYTNNAICLNTLPVNLTSFNAVYSQANKSTLLQWVTSNEFSSDYFDIEKSNDEGKNFVSIGTQKAHGTSSSDVHYQFTDMNPKAGANFYRLKQVDIDGNFKYSSIVSVIASETGNSIISVYPNPAHDFVYINSTNFTAASFAIKLINSQGEIVKDQKINIGYRSPMKLDLSNIQKGVYFLKIYPASGEMTVQKIIVQ